MDPAGDLKVPQHRAYAQLLLFGMAPRRVELFVAWQEERACRRQELLGLLEQPQAFLPIWDPDERQVAIINKDSLVWLCAVAEPSDEEDADPALFDQRRRVRVELTGGETLEGDVLYSAPSSQSRLSDHLNAPGRFLRLQAGERLLFIGKTFVLRAMEITTGAPLLEAC